MIDSCTRWVEIVLIENIETETIIQAFYNSWMVRYPIHECAHSDKGTQFVSSNFINYLKSLGIKHTTAMGDNPQGNLICERVNLTIGIILRIYKGYE